MATATKEKKAAPAKKASKAKKPQAPAPAPAPAEVEPVAEQETTPVSVQPITTAQEVEDNPVDHDTRPVVTREGVFSLQVCVPEGFSDEEVEKFANSTRPAGPRLGWAIRREAEYKPEDGHERVPCGARVGCVHIVLDC